VRVYQWKESKADSDSNWVKLGLDIDGEAAYDQSAYDVALSADGTIVAIGAIGNDDNGSYSGHVRVYEWNETIWLQRGADIDGEAANDQSGRSVALSADGTIVAIGANGNNDNGINSGHVRVYQWNDSNWAQRGADIDGEAAYDLSGFSVALSADGTIVAIGAIQVGKDGSGISSGHVRVYQWNDSNWAQRGDDIDGEAAYDQSGYDVALSADGTIVAIGTIQVGMYGSGRNHVRVYQWSSINVSWNQRGDDIDGEADGDKSGWSVALSADVAIGAIGANGNDGNGIDSGHVRVYDWNETVWLQRGDDINGEAAGDQSGWSVALSADGSIVAIGAPYNANDGSIVAIGATGNDDNGGISGHVRVYEFQCKQFHRD